MTASLSRADVDRIVSEDRANATTPDLWRADLRGADLRDADLRGADLLGADLDHPFGERPSVALEATELPMLHARAAVVRFEDGAGRDLRLMDVQTDDALVQRLQFHHLTFFANVSGGGWQASALNCLRVQMHPRPL